MAVKAVKAKMKVEYRNLPHNCGKVHKLGIGAGSLHEAALQEIKDISFSHCIMIIPQCIQ